MASRVGGKPGEEYPLTDKRHHTWAFTCLSDGRLFVDAKPPQQPRGYYLMTPNPSGSPLFEPVEFDLTKRGTLDRVSISPSETRILLRLHQRI